MSESIHWVKKQLRNKLKFEVIDNNIGEFERKGAKVKIYCPTTEEYEITVNVLLNASRKGAVVLAYPTTWCKATREAIEYGKTLGIDVIPFGKFLAEYVP